MKLCGISSSDVCYEDDVITNTWWMSLDSEFLWNPDHFKKRLSFEINMFALLVVHHRQHFLPLLHGFMSVLWRQAHTHLHKHKQKMHWLRLPLIKKPFSRLSSCCPLLCPAETKKRRGRRNGQPLIKFPPLFLSVPPMLFSYRFWALALCDSQENKQAFRPSDKNTTV